MTANFPFARTLIALSKETTKKKTGETTLETRYYISSHLRNQYTDLGWIELIRGHWGGVEIRNHWQRDTNMGEDGSRTRNANALANLALIRSAVLVLLANAFPGESLPVIQETLHSNGTLCMKMVLS